MVREREDIDWGKLRLIVSKFKKDFGVSDGKLNWTQQIADNFVSELKSKNNNSDSQSQGDSPDVDNSCISDQKQISVKENPTEKRKLPSWMNSSSQENKDVAVKKKKIF